MSSNSRAGAGASALLIASAVALAASAVGASEDLAALRVTPIRGQSADQLRRDRYECHNWAVEQTGSAPLAAPVAQEADKQADRAQRAERVQRVIAGAALGGALGGLIRGVQNKDPDNGVLAGAAVGAAVGAATGERGGKNGEEEAPASDYLRALTACLEGRGYTVALPGADDVSSASSSPRSTTPPAGTNVAASATVTVGY
ncbi:MAG TPA: hypothetical protein VFJ95_15790 [Gammaproteobacteria bacterium]|nr:hypothetical protein [Gammaproteobacteria bacterium]